MWCTQSTGYLEQYNRCRLNVVLSCVNDFYGEQSELFCLQVQQSSSTGNDSAVGHMTLKLSFIDNKYHVQYYE